MLSTNSTGSLPAKRVSGICTRVYSKRTLQRRNRGRDSTLRTVRSSICIVRILKPQPGEVVQDPAAGTGGFLVAADRKGQGDEGRFRYFSRQEIAARGDNLDIAWLKDSSNTPEDEMTEADELAAAIAAHLRNALD